jgi:4-hydroxythreonine-4-phosphate dehydrogenase
LVLFFKKEHLFSFMTQPLAITMGDPAGVGPEITAAAWHALRHDAPRFVVLADPDTIARYAPIRIIRPGEPITREDFANSIPILSVPLAKRPTPGQPNPENAAAIIASIEHAVRLTQAGQTSAVVTNPISKAVLKSAGFAHPGHTEFLAALTGVAGREVMMLASPDLRVVPVTIHVSLRQALATLTTAAIIAIARTTAAALQKDFGIAAPRLAIAGLNPHAGEQGHMGDEETTIIQPAIDVLRATGLHVTGPHPPDTMFTAAARAQYDAAICMYHDQALIPLKTLDMWGGINITLGLPIVRTSPDHGTAFDIAGQGTASPASLIAAIRMAAAIARNRAA